MRRTPILSNRTATPNDKPKKKLPREIPTLTPLALGQSVASAASRVQPKTHFIHQPAGTVPIRERRLRDRLSARRGRATEREGVSPSKAAEPRWALAMWGDELIHQHHRGLGYGGWPARMGLMRGRSSVVGTKSPEFVPWHNLSNRCARHGTM